MSPTQRFMLNVLAVEPLPVNPLYVKAFGSNGAIVLAWLIQAGASREPVVFNAGVAQAEFGFSVEDTIDAIERLGGVLDPTMGVGHFVCAESLMNALEGVK